MNLLSSVHSFFSSTESEEARLRVAALPPDVLSGHGGLDVDGLHVVGPADGVVGVVPGAGVAQLLLAHDAIDLWG